MIERAGIEGGKEYQPLHWRMIVHEYKAILLFSGIAMAFLLWQLPWGSRCLCGLYFALMMVILSIMDLRYGLLYDKLVLPLFIMGLLLSVMDISLPWQDAVTGAFSAGGFLWGLRMISGGGLGLGDVKLGLAIGAWLGWQAVAVALFLAFLAGGMAASFLLLMCKGRPETAIPFGPFLALGAYVGFIFGQDCWQAYLTLL